MRPLRRESFGAICSTGWAWSALRFRPCANARRISACWPTASASYTTRNCTEKSAGSTKRPLTCSRITAGREMCANCSTPSSTPWIFFRIRSAWSPPNTCRGIFWMRARRGRSKRRPSRCGGSTFRWTRRFGNLNATPSARPCGMPTETCRRPRDFCKSTGKSCSIGSIVINWTAPLQNNQTCAQKKRFLLAREGAVFYKGAGCSACALLEIIDEKPTATKKFLQQEQWACQIYWLIGTNAPALRLTRSPKKMLFSKIIGTNPKFAR